MNLNALRGENDKIDVCPTQSDLIKGLKEERSAFVDLDENEDDTSTIKTTGFIKFEAVYVKSEANVTESNIARSCFVVDERENEQKNDNKTHTRTEHKYAKNESVQKIEGDLSLGKFSSESVELIYKTENDTCKRNDTVTSEEIDIKYEPLEAMGVAGFGERLTDTQKEAISTPDDLLVHKIVPHKHVYRCDQCEYKTKGKFNLTKHVLAHSDSSNIHNLLPKYSSKKKPHTCETCGFKTNKESNLKLHIMLIHKDSSKIEMYKCGTCNYETKYESHLNTHMLTHLDPFEKIYKCELCDYTSHLANHMKQHQIVHKDFSETDVYKCDKCEYRTKWKSNLKSHEEVHEDPAQRKKYTCTFCCYVMKSKHCFDRHILKHPVSS